MLRPGAAVVLDTETTDLPGAIIEVAIIDAATGETLLDTFIDPGPEVQFAPGATAVHGLDRGDIAEAPTWKQVWPQVLATTAGRTVLAYHADYDRGVLAADCTRHQLDPERLAEPNSWGCILAHRTTASGNDTRLALNGGHRALGDTHAALAVLAELARTPDCTHAPDTTGEGTS